jgi:hypothetical protein
MPAVRLANFLCDQCVILLPHTPAPCATKLALNEILEAFTIYYRGNSLEDTSRRLSSRHGHIVNPATISRWLAADPDLTT